MKRVDEDIDRDWGFPPEPDFSIWRIAFVCIIAALFLIMMIAEFAAQADAGEYRNHEWHTVESSRCFSELSTLPVVFTTLRKIGSSGPIKRRVKIGGSSKQSFRIITYSRKGADYVFDLRLRRGLRGCVDAWRTRYLDAFIEEEAS